MQGRILAIDVGARRIGLAISDVSATLARPLETIAVTNDADAVAQIVRRIGDLSNEDGGLVRIVVGLPTQLDGLPSPQTAKVTAFIEKLKKKTSLAIVTEGESLSSREAESRLAVHEKDWRKRKKMLDAAAAAIILQDYLDRR
jgi:putative Holliday junction resolvase